MQNEVYGYTYDMNTDEMFIVLKDSEGEEYTKVCHFTTIEYHKFFAPYYGEGDLAKIQEKWKNNVNWNLDPVQQNIIPVE